MTALEQFSLLEYHVFHALKILIWMRGTYSLEVLVIWKAFKKNLPFKFQSFLIGGEPYKLLEVITRKC